MAPSPRIESPRAIYPVINRGNYGGEAWHRWSPATGAGGFGVLFGRGSADSSSRDTANPGGGGFAIGLIRDDILTPSGDRL